MNDELPKMYSLDREEVQKEKDGKAVRTVFAAHTFSDVYSNHLASPTYSKASNATSRR